MATLGSMAVGVGSNGDYILGFFPVSHKMHHFSILMNTFEPWGIRTIFLPICWVRNNISLPNSITSFIPERYS